MDDGWIRFGSFGSDNRQPINYLSYNPERGHISHIIDRPPSHFTSSTMANEATSEEYDSFDVGAFEFDPASIAHVDATGQAFLPHRNRHSGERSAATTQLATDVGSTVLKSHVPFLKSITFFDPKVYYHREVKEDDRSNNGDIPPLPNHDDDGMLGFADLSQWDIQLKDPIKNGDEKSGLLRQIGNRIGTKLKPSKIPKICVQDFNGLLELSSIQSGDSLVSVNKRAISPKDMNADEARDFMNVCIENDGVLNVVTESFTGNGK